MQTINIALLQITPYENVRDNLTAGVRACEHAREMGADVALFPELWQVGYQQKLFTDHNAINHHSEFMQTFCTKARELEMAIAITYLGKTPSKPTNNIALIDRTGTIVLEYSKVHVCNFTNGAEINLQPGKDFPITQLQYAGGSVCVGTMICFDREFPESAQALARQGAEIILVPNACHLAQDKKLGDIRLQQIRSRAFENMVVMAVANYPAPRYDGNSCICAANGAFICKADVDEEIMLGSIDVTALLRWRKEEVWGPVKNY